MKTVRMGLTSAAPNSLRRRLGWLALIWTLSVAALAVVALGFRLLMALAGLTG